MEIIDQESRILSQRILNEFHLNEIRNNFISILGINKTHFGITDFTNLIHRLAENNQVSQFTIQECFNIFDENKDGKLDWNEYLKLFVEYLKKVQCLTYLKSQSSLEEQSQYLQQLQIAFLASPFKQLFTTQNLQSVEQILASFENRSSNKQIKKYYFICRDSFEPSLNQLHQDIILFQDFNILPAQIIQVLKSLLLQRLPHVKINKIDYANQMIVQIINNGYCNHLFKLLLVDDEKEQGQNITDEKDQNQILGMQALTLIAATIHIYDIQILIPIQSNLLVDTILNIISETQNDLIIEQGYILLGHLILYDKSFQQILFTKRQALLDIQQIDDEKIFYHSWFIGCLFSRYESHQASKFMTQMNKLPDNLLWLQSIIAYYQQYGLIQSIEKNQIRIQIQINMLIIIQPLLATQIHQDVLIALLQQLQNQATDNRFKLQILSTLKKIFKLPYQLNYQNFTAQNILLSNNLLNILMQLITDPNSQISYQAKKLFFKTLCLENSGILLKYLQESNNLQSFLYVLESQFVQNVDANFQKYFKYKILTILRLMSQDSNTFQILSTDQWLFKLLIKALNDNNQVFTSNNQIMINCQYDYLVINEITEYCITFNLHFQPMLRQKPQLSYQALETIYQILPNQQAINEIKQYFVKLLENIDKYQPLILKKYLKPLYQSVCEIVTQVTHLILSLNDLIKNNQVFHNNFTSFLQYLINDLAMFQEYLTSKKELIDDTLLIIGTEATYDGCVVTTVYLNTYQNSSKCKIVLKPQLTLLEFEKHVEQGLQTSGPLLYLVINQNHPNKIPYDDFSIIDEVCFRKFKELADQFIETQFGSVKVSQEVIAVELFRLKMEDYSMKKIYEILNKGSSYIQFKQIQDNQMLWFLENNSDTKDKGQQLQQIFQLTKLPYTYIENLFDSINQFFDKNNLQQQYRQIQQDNFKDYLQDMKIPPLLGDKIATFLARNGLKNPIDFQDFICFVSIFYQQSFSETIIMKFTYLLYANKEGKFGKDQLCEYLQTIFDIQNQIIYEQQINEWGSNLFVKIDQNQDGHISFYEYHALLKEEQYRAKLLDPICALFTNLPFQNTTNRFFFGTPQKLFRS
ncbi:unnamed protein product [Paramecium pentaurelia]|uniref:EF-hand domain-containing protein n=1 Tax=Paramecium pentaurelia TaxID=43138 RepID=A0A8S1XLA9_9CILI|nr:unnamed protein product [Paramecium pentaurelia]